MKPSLKARKQAAIVESGVDEETAGRLIRALERRGIALVADGRDHCRCFPRTKEPKQQDGHYVCQLCFLRIEHDHERRIARELGVRDES